MASWRLLLGLVLAYAAMAAFTALVYRAGVTATLGAVAGLLGMLALAIGVAWASNRARGGSRS